MTNKIENEIIKAKCVYCQVKREVKIWEETDELVCFDCRKDLLEEEFEI